MRPPMPVSTTVYQLAPGCNPFAPLMFQCLEDGSVVIESWHRGPRPKDIKLWFLGLVLLLVISWFLAMWGYWLLLIPACVLYLFLGMAIAAIESSVITLRFAAGQPFSLSDDYHVVCRPANDPGIYYWPKGHLAMRLFRNDGKWFLEVDDAFPEAPTNEVFEGFQFRHVLTEQNPHEASLADGAIVLTANSGNVRVMNKVYDARREWRFLVDNVGDGFMSRANDNRIFVSLGHFKSILELLPANPPNSGLIYPYSWVERSVKFVPAQVRSSRAAVSVAS